MTRHTTVLILAACAIALVPAWAAGASSSLGVTSVEHVINGSFEDASVAPWSSRATLALDADIVADGARSLRVEASGGYLVRQTLFDVAPGTYRLRGAVRQGPTPDGALRLQVTPSDRCAAGCDFEIPPEPNAWFTIAADTTMTATSDVVLQLVGSGGVAWLDDVSFFGPPPATRTPTPTPVTPTVQSAGTSPSPQPSPTPRSSATPTPDTANVIATGLENGGFESWDETGMPAAWSKYGGAVVASSDAHGGAHAAELRSATTASKWLYQTLLVDPGGGYEFSAWLLADDPAVASAFLRVSWYESKDGSGGAIGTDDSTARLESPSGEYRQLTTGPVRAPASARSAKLRVMLDPVSNAPAAITVDDARWDRREIGEPAIATPAAIAPGDAGAAEASPTNTRRATRGGGATHDAPLPATSGSTTIGLRINEVLYDPDGDKRDATAEWVELYNAQDTAVSLAGWQLADNRAADVLPELSVPAHAFVVISPDAGFTARYPGFAGLLALVDGSIGNSLGNDGDRVMLVAPDGRVVDAVSWGQDASAFAPPVDHVPAGHSIERRQAGLDRDTADDWVDNESPSPGAPIAPRSIAPDKASPEQLASPSGASGHFGWLPWALLAGSGMMLVSVLAWRAAPALTSRLRLHRHP